MASGGALIIESAAGTPATASTREEVMLIGEVAVVVGLEPKTIRFYERVELVNPEKHGRIRIFRKKDVARLMAIKKLRQYGFSIAGIRKILKTEGDLTMETVGSPSVQKLLADRLEEMKLKSEFMQEQIAELSSRIGVSNTNQ